MRQSREDRAFSVVNTGLLLLISLLLLYPMYYIVIASFSEPTAVASGKVALLPAGFTLDAYRYLLKYDTLWIGYRNTIFYTVGGTLLSLALTVPAAYVLTKKRLPGRGLLVWFFLFTMYFSGGMIPTYLLVRDLGLINKPYTLALLSSLSVYNIVITRVFFESTIPEELYEAGQIDGVSEIGAFFSIALPLAAPIVAVMALYYGVARWNDYFNALLYVRDVQYMPLQIMLRSILISNENIISQIDMSEMTQIQTMEYMRIAQMAQVMKYAVIFIASAPVIMAYPFVQKYFVKGIMIGSLKG